MERSKRNLSGRKVPSWRADQHHDKMLAMDILVPVRPCQQTSLVNKLQAIQQAGRHIFEGTTARYIIKGDAAFTTLHILLIWKDIELPVEATRQKDLQAFQQELHDVLDWGKATYSMNEVIIHR